MNAARDLPDNFRRIRLELAREPEHPQGDTRVGYVVLAPLTNAGLLDVHTARAYKEACRVVRFRPDEDNDNGFLRRRPGGSWAFHYDFEDGEDDDPGFRLGEHRFVVGEYLTILEDEGPRTYRVSAVQMLV